MHFMINHIAVLQCSGIFFFFVCVFLCTYALKNMGDLRLDYWYISRTGDVYKILVDQLRDRIFIEKLINHIEVNIASCILIDVTKLFV